MKSIITAFLIIFIAISAYANDAAVETAVGGLKLRKEHSVLMKKEQLYISHKLIRIEYEFLNTSKDTVTSDVAFPIPPIIYSINPFDWHGDFSDFKAWVNNKPLKIDKEVRAFVKNREITEELRKANLSIESFGDYNPEDTQNPIFKLKPEIQASLVEIGALTAPGKKEATIDLRPLWETHIKYHWQQIFPPGVIVRIKHEYQPVEGYKGSDVQNFKKEFTDTCIDQKKFEDIEKLMEIRNKKDHNFDNYIKAFWVSYILTTANTWQTPIKEFELIVEGDKRDHISFCWDGPVEKIGTNKARAVKKNFIPKRDLKVYFFFL